MKKQYIAPKITVVELSLLDGLLTDASYQGEKVLESGGKASDNEIISADARITVPNAWEEGW
ncbi:MAG: hypothetical protein IKP30_00080 [Bacteroidaceae bacterium]|nr:hypothetical protein [Bacteroidaceae bacterium]